MESDLFQFQEIAEIHIARGKEQLAIGYHFFALADNAQVVTSDFIDVIVHVDGGKERLASGNCLLRLG